MIEFEWNHLVEWGECDPAQIVFYPNIYRWFDKSSHDMMKHHGFGQAEMIERHGIVGFPLIETHAEFRKPMRWGDHLLITSGIESHSRKTFTVTHKIYNSDELCVHGHETRIWGIRDSDNALCAWEMPEDFVKNLSLHE